jgi:hypothetical protein
MKPTNWKDTAELVGIVAIVLGLILVAYELRQNTKMMQAQTRTQITEEVVELFSVNMNDRDYANVLVRGNNLEELSAVEQYQYYRHRSAWANYWVNVAYQHKMGMYDEAEFLQQMTNIRRDMEIFPGLKVHWCAWRNRASRELIEALEGDLSGSYCAAPE